MRLNRLHAAAVASASSHTPEVRGHQRARRTSSDDNSRPTADSTDNRIGTIPELTEAFHKKVCVREQRAGPGVSISLV